MSKIAIFVNTLMKGGSEKQSVLLYNILYKSYDTIFIVYHNKIDNQSIILFDDYPYSKIIFLQGNDFNKIISLYKLLKKYQITHLINYLTKPNAIGSIIGFFAKVKYRYNSVRSSKLPTWKLLIEKNISNKFSTETIVNSYCGFEYLKKNKFKNIRIIQNCFPELKTPEFHRDFKQVKVITVGRFVPVKDYLTAIKAIKELTIQGFNIQFLIVGYGQLESYINSEIDKNGITTITQIIINPNNISELLQSSNIYLSTSLIEGTSNSIMEAMNASLPIIATNVGDNNRLVINNKNGFLHEVKDYINISKSMKYLIENPKVQVNFGIESNRILKENYSLSAYKSNYLKIIEKY